MKMCQVGAEFFYADKIGKIVSYKSVKYILRDNFTYPNPVFVHITPFRQMF